MSVASIFPIYILFLPKHPYWSESYCQNRQTASLLVFLWFLKQHRLQTDRALTRCSELIAASTFLGCHGYSDVGKERSPLLPFSHPSTPWRQLSTCTNPTGSLSPRFLWGDPYIQICPQMPWHGTQCRRSRRSRRKASFLYSVPSWSKMRWPRRALPSSQYVRGISTLFAYLLVIFRRALPLSIARPSSGLQMTLVIPLSHPTTFFPHNEAQSNAR